MKKSSFWNFWFSLIPGCGQLYLGAQKKGSILLASFFGTMAISALLGFDFLKFLLPIIWFYAFFDSMNLKHLSQEQLEINDTEFADKVSSLLHNNAIFKKSHAIIGIALVIIGLYMLANNFIPSFILEIAWISNFFYKFPTLLVAIGIIALGGFLIKGKRSNPDFVEYKGGNNDGKQQ